MEQTQRGGTEERSAILVSALKKMGVALDVEQAFDVEQPKDVEQAQRYGTGPKMWNGPKEVEQRKRSVMLFSAFGKK